jgi:hypothetical protein
MPASTRRRFEAQLYVSRVGLEFQHWGKDSVGRQSRREAQENYRQYLAAHDREADLDRWAGQAKRVVGVDPGTWEQED